MDGEGPVRGAVHYIDFGISGLNKLWLGGLQRPVVRPAVDDINNTLAGRGVQAASRCLLITV